jgi:hypothetical protein
VSRESRTGKMRDRRTGNARRETHWADLYPTPYLLLAGGLWIGLLFQTWQQQWSNDVWVHASAIRELMENPLDPGSPFVAERLPHYSLSLYHWVAAQAGAFFQLDAIGVTQLLGAMNGLLVLVAFPPFARVFLRHRHAPVVALLAVLLLWGPDAWRYSGFLHLNAIGFGLPFPSMFSTWVTFGTVAWFDRFATESSLRPLAVLGLATVGFVVSNAHAITFQLLVIALLALVIDRKTRATLFGFMSVVVGAVGGAVLWPFFDLFDLTLNASSVLDGENAVMYSTPFVRIAPALLGLPVLWSRFRRNPTDRLVVIFLASAMVYLAGWLLGRMSLGRSVLFAVLALHLAIAGWALEVWERSGSRRRTQLAAATVVVSVTLLVPMLTGVVRMFPFPLLPESIRTDSRLDIVSGHYRPLVDVIGHSDVVLAPTPIAERITAFAGTTVSPRRIPYLNDAGERSAAVSSFLANPTLDHPALDQYNVDWVIVPLTALGEIGDLGISGEVFELQEFVVVRVSDVSPSEPSMSRSSDAQDVGFPQVSQCWCPTSSVGPAAVPVSAVPGPIGDNTTNVVSMTAQAVDRVYAGLELRGRWARVRSEAVRSHPTGDAPAGCALRWGRRVGDASCSDGGHEPGVGSDSQRQLHP